MSIGPVSKSLVSFPCSLAAAIALSPAQANAQTTLEIGIGIQNTTTNTVTGGAVLKELGLFEKHLPTTGKYKDFKYSLSWQNATSGPPITNGMMANNIQIGMMGDYPADGERRHRAGDRQRNPTGRDHRLQRRKAAATASSFTRTRRITTLPISRARTSRFRSAPPRTA